MERPMPTYLLRPKATEFLKTEHGVELGRTGLANMAVDNKGPRYAIINGRAVYTRKDLTAWVQEQASITPLRIRRRAAKAAQASAETAAA
jgi:hypothetical protein